MKIRVISHKKYGTSEYSTDGAYTIEIIVQKDDGSEEKIIISESETNKKPAN